jgi:hypothetical protein
MHDNIKSNLLSRPMNKAASSIAILLLTFALNACSPPEPAPAPHFIPNPPYPPQPIDPGTVQSSQAAGETGGISPNATPSTGIAEYPLAKPTSKPNEVISPYEPYHTIDISGFSPGQLARDPSNRKIFRVP